MTDEGTPFAAEGLGKISRCVLVKCPGVLRTYPAQTLNRPLLDPGTTSWPGAIPVVAVALMLLIGPGMIAALLLRAPWLTALALAPGLSTTAVVLVTVASSAIGVPWAPAPRAGGTRPPADRRTSRDSSSSPGRRPRPVARVSNP